MKSGINGSVNDASEAYIEFTELILRQIRGFESSCTDQVKPLAS